MSGTRNRSNTVSEVARIRQLLKTYSVSKTAEIVGRTPASVSQIKHGHRHKEVKELSINSLNLRRTPPNYKCRCCGTQAMLTTTSHLCVECELFNLHKQGLIQIE